MKEYIIITALLLAAITAAAVEESEAKRPPRRQSANPNEPSAACKRQAADAGAAEFYLNPKTGKIEWRWRASNTYTLSSGSLYSNSLVTQ